MAGPSCRGPHSCRDIRQSGHHQSPNVQQTTELSPCSATYCHTATSKPAQSSKPVRARPAGLRSKASMSIETSAFLSQAGGSDWVTLGLGTVRKVTAWLGFVLTFPKHPILTSKIKFPKPTPPPPADLASPLAPTLGRRPPGACAPCVCLSRSPSPRTREHIHRAGLARRASQTRHEISDLKKTPNPRRPPCTTT